MIIGNQKNIEDLKNLADKKQLNGSYLFFGPSQIGKRQIALALANYLENGDFSVPDNKSQILADAFLINPDEGGIIGIDQVREIKDFLWQKPTRSPSRSLIVNDSECLTEEAQNAILKITEEPPKSSLIILIASDPEKLWPTLLSRLKKICFSVVSRREMEDWLLAQKKFSKEKAVKLADWSGGKPGLALDFEENDDFKKMGKTARNFLKIKNSREISEFIKELVIQDDFNLKKFLDIMILILSFEERKANCDFWHDVLKLRREADYIGLNPRLQLENLAFLKNNLNIKA